MIRVPAAELRTPYPSPYSEPLEAGFGSALECECLCGLVRRAVGEAASRASLFEIGTHRGAGLRHFHAMVPELELHSLNVLPEQLAHLPRQMASEILPREEIGRFAVEAGVSFVQHYGNSRTFNWEALAAQKQFDIVFVDGSHEQFTVFADTLHARQILKPGGWIIWHDYKVIDEPGRQVFAAVNDLDEHEFGGQIHHVEGTWLAYARHPEGATSRVRQPAVQEAPRTAPDDACLRLKVVPTFHATPAAAVAWHLAHGREASFARRVAGLPAIPKVLFFADHHDPVWPGAEELRCASGDFEITQDPRQIRQADMVVFHLPQVPAWTRLPRHDRQIWVGVTMEPDGYYPSQADPSRMASLDLLLSYHAWADLQMTYASPGTLAQTLQPPPAKDPEKLVCAFVSNSHSLSGRERFITLLERHLPVHHFGQWHHNQPGAPPIGRGAKLEVLRQYQFCLAIENCLQDDYVSEKWYDCLVAGCVPIYSGAPNIEEYAPGPGAFVQISSADSAAQLAAKIKVTACATPHYQSYFTWKKQVAPSFKRIYEREVDRLSLMEKIALMIDQTRGPGRK
ncbi:glycosyltransferase family 10 [Verrucomicrobium sp. BvORR106]|uniref:glycosyltransferase family 10 domain-containing protein n=1 Tax=Verrucomicrobium sp. BvORR106 TaxID=1403819 RepID=UPI00056DE9ED|nr:glycosyltransferase family 10 [Verrucomicrobium sp. BvORR106]